MKTLVAAALTTGSALDAIEAFGARLKITVPSRMSNAMPLDESAQEDPDVSKEPLNGDYFEKLRNFNSPHKDDYYLTGQDLDLMQSSWLKLKKVMETVGHGNFNIIGYNDFLKACNNYPHIGYPSREELDFIEKIFYTDAQKYGFYGERVFKDLTYSIPSNEIEELPGTGQHLFRAKSVSLYAHLNRHIGNSLVMTSGVRGVPKQLYLFLNRGVRNKGNLSLSSRAIAPPGYSFHGCGDFDIGRYGWGYRNFTSEFETTPEFKELYRLGYVKLRYPFGNNLGVRYEPWHVMIQRAV